MLAGCASGLFWSSLRGCSGLFGAAFFKSLQSTRKLQVGLNNILVFLSPHIVDDDQRRMTAILARPDVQQALQCPEIQQIIELARQNSLEAHE